MSAVLRLDASELNESSVIEGILQLFHNKRIEIRETYEDDSALTEDLKIAIETEREKIKVDPNYLLDWDKVKREFDGV